jgi:folylpolyglutamate synthase/dihydropteroate synthase
MEVISLPCGAGGHRAVAALLDGGHNEAALPHIAATLRAAAAVVGVTGVHIVYACGATRDAAGLFAALVALLGAAQGSAPPISVTAVSCVAYATPEGMPWAAATEPSDLVAAVARSVAPGVPVLPFACVRDAAAAVEEEGEGEGVPILLAVLGSLYLVSDTHRWLQGQG